MLGLGQFTYKSRGLFRFNDSCNFLTK